NKEKRDKLLDKSLGRLKAKTCEMKKLKFEQKDAEEKTGLHLAMIEQNQDDILALQEDQNKLTARLNSLVPGDIDAEGASSDSIDAELRALAELTNNMSESFTSFKGNFQAQLDDMRDQYDEKVGLLGEIAEDNAQGVEENAEGVEELRKEVKALQEQLAVATPAAALATTPAPESTPPASAPAPKITDTPVVEKPDPPELTTPPPSTAHGDGLLTWTLKKITGTARKETSVKGGKPTTPLAEVDTNRQD
ncbi:hypothetical protein TrRE_jg308, partial [Triparma retinervis]